MRANEPLFEVCEDLSKIAWMFHGSQTTLTWDFAINWDTDFPNGVESMHVKTDFSSSAISAYITSNFSAEGKKLTSQLTERTIFRDVFGIAYARLHTHRKHVEPMLKQLSKELRKVEETQEDFGEMWAKRTAEEDAARAKEEVRELAKEEADREEARAWAEEAEAQQRRRARPSRLSRGSGTFRGGRAAWLARRAGSSAGKRGAEMRRSS